jgi:hypothetical protein
LLDGLKFLRWKDRCCIHMFTGYVHLFHISLLWNWCLKWYKNKNMKLLLRFLLPGNIFEKTGRLPNYGIQRHGVHSYFPIRITEAGEQNCSDCLCHIYLQFWYLKRSQTLWHGMWINTYLFGTGYWYGSFPMHLQLLKIRQPIPQPQP